MIFFSRKLYYFDWWLLISVLILMLFGVIAVYTASAVKIGTDVIIGNDYLKQLLWISTSLVAIIVLLKLPLQIIEILIVPAHIFVLITMIIVLFMPEIKGSSRWIMIGPLQMQPAEFAKVTTILVLAKVLSKPNLSEIQIILRTVFIGLPPIILLYLQPDLGSTIIYWMIILTMLLFSGLPNFYVILVVSPFLAVITSFYLPAFIVFILLITFVLFKMNLDWVIIGFTNVINIFIFFLTPFIWNSMKVYQQNRILSFVDPTRDPLGSGYQAIQSRIAIGSGMFQGKGFLQGTQKNLNFLPERHTDFIYSVIAEEFGFIGSMVILIVFFFFISRLIRSLNKITIPERRLFIVGTIGFITTQIIINIAINLGIFPTTGLPLPFISYGGSSLMANSIAVGIILKYLAEKSFV